MTDVRKGMPSVELDKEEFGRRLRQRFVDPAYDKLKSEIDRIVEVAWDAYIDGRKAPHTRRAGEGFADPDYELSLDWLAAREAIARAAERHKSGKARILLINGSPRSDQTCPGEMSKSWRLLEIARQTVEAEGLECELLDLSHTTSEYGRNIFPCKSCVSTAMPLCHWPCSCYPNHSLGQVQDWMNDIYPMWTAAHGVMIVTPVHWYQAPAPLKAMMDRLVCADGGNPDPTSTGGKKPDKAKELELAGWNYPRHLAGRVFSVIVHGDAAGAETLRRNLADWLSDMGLHAAGSKAVIDRYIGYYESYAENHAALDGDSGLQEEVRNAARTLSEAVRLMRHGMLERPGAKLREPRPK